MQSVVVRQGWSSCTLREGPIPLTHSQRRLEDPNRSPPCFASLALSGTNTTRTNTNMTCGKICYQKRRLWLHQVNTCAVEPSHNQSHQRHPRPDTLNYQNKTVALSTHSPRQPANIHIRSHKIFLSYFRQSATRRQGYNSCLAHPARNPDFRYWLDNRPA